MNVTQGQTIKTQSHFNGFLHALRVERVTDKAVLLYNFDSRVKAWFPKSAFEPVFSEKLQASDIPRQYGWLLKGWFKPSTQDHGKVIPC